MTTSATDNRGAGDAADPILDDAAPCAAYVALRDGFAAGELSEHQHADMAAHVARCAACRAEITAFDALRRLTLQVGEQERAAAPPPEALIEGILGRIAPTPRRSDD